MSIITANVHNFIIYKQLPMFIQSFCGLATNVEELMIQVVGWEDQKQNVG